MCGRYGFYRADEFGERFGVNPPPFEIKDNFNAAPGQILPVVIETPGYGKTLEPMKWGLIPKWAKDERIGYKMINARAESLFEKPAWRSVVKYRRCLVPARGFYEWQRARENGKQVKQPYYIKLIDSELFAFAGLYDVWVNPLGQEVWSYSIVTTAVNPDMKAIHDREPVVLKQGDEALWLDPELQERAVIEELLNKYPDEQFEMTKVSRDVNTASINDEHLIYPINSQ